MSLDKWFPRVKCKYCKSTIRKHDKYCRYCGARQFAGYEWEPNKEQNHDR